VRQERTRSDAVGCLRHVPGALSDRAVAAVLAVRLQYAGDRESPHRIRIDGRVQLGADTGAAADSRSKEGVVTSPSLRGAKRRPFSAYCASFAGLGVRRSA